MFFPLWKGNQERQGSFPMQWEVKRHTWHPGDALESLGNPLPNLHEKWSVKYSSHCLRSMVTQGSQE